MLQLSKVWLADGTFKNAPILFTQVHAIHALRRSPELMKGEHLLTSISVLQPNKTEITYLAGDKPTKTKKMQENERTLRILLRVIKTLQDWNF